MKFIETEITKKEYKKICIKIANGDRHIADDLYQDFCLAVLEANKEKIEDAIKLNYLKYYFVSIIRNLYYQRVRKNSNLYIISNECIDIDSMNIDLIEEEQEKKDFTNFFKEKKRITESPKTIHERADALLMELHNKLGSITEVAKYADMPYATIRHRLKQLALYGNTNDN